MKKSTFVFCSRLRAYWVQIPFIVLLALCICFNSNSKAVFKLYPLMVACVLAMIFVFIFYFRMIKFTYAEVRYIGWFSRRDRCDLLEGRTIILDRINRFRVYISVVGMDNTVAGLDWLKNESKEPEEIVLFRGKCIGGKNAIKRVLKYFKVDAADLSDILNEEIVGFKKDYDFATVTTEKHEEQKRIKIRINETI